MRQIPLALLGVALMTHASDCHFEMRLNDPEGSSTLVVGVRTVGAPTDDDGYVLSVRRGGEPLVEPIRLRDDESRELQLQGTTAAVDVLLEDVAPHCRVLGDNPRRTSSGEGSRAAVDFRIHCGV